MGLAIGKLTLMAMLGLLKQELKWVLKPVN
jgi:hypothetical protein